ncbi:lipase family protein, partial [Vibrio parahaemolyticus]|uniref:lipase family protein n=1 Tax=Vibrio parahaemolyticus TaxID=670 RepID=UPI00402BF2AE
CKSLQYNKVAAYIAGYSEKIMKAPKVIHCVGHSLGGALASLATDWVSKIVSSILTLLRIPGLVYIKQQKMRSYLSFAFLLWLRIIINIRIYIPHLKMLV